MQVDHHHRYIERGPLTLRSFHGKVRRLMRGGKFAQKPRLCTMLWGDLWVTEPLSCSAQ